MSLQCHYNVVFKALDSLWQSHICLYYNSKENITQHISNGWWYRTPLKLKQEQTVSVVVLCPNTVWWSGLGPITKAWLQFQLWLHHDYQEWLWLQSKKTDYITITKPCMIMIMITCSMNWIWKIFSLNATVSFEVFDQFNCNISKHEKSLISCYYFYSINLYKKEINCILFLVMRPLRNQIHWKLCIKSHMYAISR